MYCKTCGFENPGNAAYCLNDGAVLNNFKKPYKVAERKAAFCQECGTSIHTNQNYCYSCGYQASVNELKHETILTDSKKSGQMAIPASAFEMPTLTTLFNKKTLIGAAVSFVLAIILSFLLNSAYTQTVNGFYQEISDNELGFLLEEDSGNLKSLFGVTDTMMMAHMIGASVDIDVIEESFSQNGKINVSMGSVIYLIIPFAALFVGGYIFAKQSVASSIREKLYGAIGIGFIYGLLLAVMTIFSGISFEKMVDESYMDLSVKLAVNYSFFGALLMGVILGAFFSVLGILSSLEKFKTTGNLPDVFQYGQAVHQGVSAVWRGLLISSAIITIAVLVLGSDIKDELMYELPFLEQSSWGAIILLIGIQLGFYFWNVFMLGSLNLTALIEGQSEGFSYSLLSGLNGKGEEFIYLMSEMKTFDLIVKFGLIVPVLLFIWAGYKIGFKSSQAGTAVHLAVFSFVFALISAFLVSITNFNLSISGDGFTNMMGGSAPSVQFGFSMAAVFIKSFLFSFAAAFAGAYVNKMRTQ